MTEADSVRSTPAVDSSSRQVFQTRRTMLAALVAAAAMPTVAAALPVAPAMTAASHPDAELVALAEQLIAAHRRSDELYVATDKMQDEFKFAYERQPVPDALLWSERDAELGLPRLYGYPKDGGPMWDRGPDVDKLREPQWLFASRTDGDDEYAITISTWKAEPSPAARARADEIIAAFDGWHIEGKPPRGYKKLCKDLSKAERTCLRLERQVAATRANTLEGMMAKVRCARAAWGLEEITDHSIENNSGVAMMAMSIIEDVQHAVATGLALAAA